MKPLTKLAFILAILTASLASQALDRNAFTFTGYKLKVTIDPANAAFAVTGSLQARNDSAAPQKQLPMQISNSLQWTSVSVGKEQVPWVQQIYTSDIDHTGALSEAILTLSNPVAPGASVTIDFSYSGTISLNNGRLLRVNTPGNFAERSDWDQITENYSAVRGLGFVVWYPVSMDAALLTDGSAVWDRISDWKQRHHNSTLEATFNVPSGKMFVSNADENAAEGDNVRIVYHSLAGITPTFTIASYQVIDRPGITVYHLPEHTQLARDYIVADEKVTQQMTDFFGTPKHKLVVVELPNSEVLPFDDGTPFYFTPLLQLNPQAAEMMMGHQVEHTIVSSPRPWINEGLATFAQLLVRERQAGREQTLSFLNQFRETLADAEKDALQRAPGKGDPLVTTHDDILMRSKAAYVWYMLRDMIGEPAISRAVQTYRADQDTQPGYVQTLIAAQAPRAEHLEQFFDDWVYRDKGLPDFKIETVYPRPTLNGLYIVTITVANDGEPCAPIVVGVFSDRGERREKGFVLGRGKTIIRVTYPGTPAKAWVNDGSVPETDIQNNTFDIKNVAPLPSQ
ncbi:MAG TPA: hypothetical protein VFU86_17070 [Terriglobales bacterium]|nr:hypothetical protein [Terriglobales bacterium]